MAIQQIISPEVTEPAAGTWSNCLRVGDTLYIAGLTARDRVLAPTGGGEYEQAKLIFERIRHLVTAAGGSMHDVVKINMYLTRIEHREAVWRARREFFEGAFPVATLVEVSALAQPEILVEVEAIAVLNQGGRPVRAVMDGHRASEFVVAEPVVTAVPVEGGRGAFPVRRVYCVGRNYASHAVEMGVDPSTEPPFFFCKPTDSVVSNVLDAVAVPYPPGTRDLHHEVELVVAIGKGGVNIAADDAARHIWGYAVGIDMTRRDLQQAMRQAGKPWEIGKTFERCTPVGPIVPIGDTGELASGHIALMVNGELRQVSDLSKQIWSTREIIATLSRLFTLMPGDLIFTGTPEGVGAVVDGDLLEAKIEGLPALQVRIGPVSQGVAA